MHLIRSNVLIIDRSHPGVASTKQLDVHYSLCKTPTSRTVEAMHLLKTIHNSRETAFPLDCTYHLLLSKPPASRCMMIRAVCVLENPWMDIHRGVYNAHRLALDAPKLSDHQLKRTKLIKLWSSQHDLFVFRPALMFVLYWVSASFTILDFP